MLIGVGVRGGNVAYWILKAILTPILRVFYRVRVEGKDTLPTRGPVILAANHRSFLDSIFLPLVLRRRVTFVAKAEYFEGAGVKGWLQRTFFSGAGQVPIDRSSGRAAEGAMRTGQKILQNGHLFGIYPEGTRSPDGRL